MAQIRLGIIGCGFISHAHAIAAQKTNGRVKIVAATSRNKSKLAEWCKQYDTEAFENAAQMLAEMKLDGVIIATPPAQHFENIAACIAAGGKAILCEKPLITTLADFIKLQEMAAAANCAILEGFMYRHHFAFREFETMANCVGKLDTIFAEFNMNIDGGDNWRQTDKSNGGIAFDFLCYPVDFCNLIANAKPQSAFAFGHKHPRTGLLESLSGQILFENGVIATIRISANTTFSQKIILSGNQAQIEMPIGFAITDKAQIITTKTEKFIDQVVATKEFNIDDNDGTLTQSPAFEQQMRHFADIIEFGKPPLCGLDQALKNLKLTLALLSTIETQQPYIFASEFGGQGI